MNAGNTDSQPIPDAPASEPKDPQPFKGDEAAIQSGTGPQPGPGGSPYRPYRPLRNIVEILNLLRENGVSGRPLRGMVVGVSSGKRGKMLGLRVSVSGMDTYVPAALSMDLRFLNEDDLLGLPVLVSVTSVDIQRRTYCMSLWAAYNQVMNGRWYPTTGKVSIGLPLHPKGEQVVILLPRGCKGLVDGWRLGKSRDQWKQACGISRPFMVGGRLSQTGRPLYTVVPLNGSSGSGESAAEKGEGA
jgi:hypothetical protein